MQLHSSKNLTSATRPVQDLRWDHCKHPLIESQCNVQARLCKSAAIPRRTKVSLLTVSQNSYLRVIEPPIVQEIISPANSYIKHCCKLVSSRPYREQAGSVLIVGHIPVQEIAEHTAVRVLFLAQGAIAPAGISSHHPASAPLHIPTQQCGRAECASSRHCLCHRDVHMQAIKQICPTSGHPHLDPKLCKPRCSGKGTPSPAGVQAETTVQVSAAVLQRLSGLESVGGMHD